MRLGLIDDPSCATLTGISGASFPVMGKLPAGASRSYGDGPQFSARDKRNDRASSRQLRGRAGAVLLADAPFDAG
jgi:hypothetical protein